MSMRPPITLPLALPTPSPMPRLGEAMEKAFDRVAHALAGANEALDAVQGTALLCPVKGKGKDKGESKGNGKGKDAAPKGPPFYVPSSRAQSATRS
eukprot:9797071-Heterocapsa_arctica.AAC.1